MISQEYNKIPPLDSLVLHYSEENIDLLKLFLSLSFPDSIKTFFFKNDEGSQGNIEDMMSELRSLKSKIKYGLALGFFRMNEILLSEIVTTYRHLL